MSETPFVAECRRILEAWLAAKGNHTAREDAEWAMTYLFQMQRTGRLEEYFAHQREIAS